MRSQVLVGALVTVLIGWSPLHGIAGQGGDAAARVVLENARVRIYRTTAGHLAGVAHEPAVIVPLETGPDAAAGDAIWVDDAATTTRTGTMRGAIVIVQPLRGNAPPPPPAASKPGDAPFVGMSFNPLF